MLCINCQANFSDHLKACPECGRQVPESWDLLKTVYPPEDNLIKGLLEVCGIPVVLRGEAIGPLQGLTMGPLAEVRIYVPSEKVEEAREVLASEFEENDDSDR